MSLESLNAKFGKKSSGSAAKKIAEHTKKHGSIARGRKETDTAFISRVVKKSASIAELLTEEDQLENLRVIREAKKAVHRIYDTEAKKLVEVPDIKHRMAAVVLDLAYREGTPIQRTLSASGSFKDLGTMLGQLQDSPQGKQLLAELPAIDVESSVIRENRTTESTVQETGAQTGEDSPSETAGQTEQS